MHLEERLLGKFSVHISVTKGLLEILPTGLDKVGFSRISLACTFLISD